MRPEPASPRKKERSAAADPVSARAELERLRMTCRRQRHAINALGRAVSTLRDRAEALHAENAQLRAAPDRWSVGVRAREARALPLDLHAPANARGVVTWFLNDQVPESVLENARLVITELVTNSVRHSGVSDGMVVIGVQLTPATVRLEVADPGRDGVICPRTPDPAAGGGFGLNMVQALSERWGLERAAAGGTRVWAQLSRMPAASGAGL
jgi:signal transduction histidine kinase